MKLRMIIISLIGLGILLNIFNYSMFLKLLSIVWYVASILIIYSSVKFSFKYKFIQLKIKKIIEAIKSKSKNNISPISSLCISLAAKIGVGSLSGVALAIYFGGVGSIFWMCIISLIVSVNTFIECKLGIKYREKIDGEYVGGPSYYINKCLGDKRLGILYGILVIVTYSGLFLSIQANTIVSALGYFDINSIYIVIVLFVGTFIIIVLGIKGISLVNSVLVPVMIGFYLLLGIYVVISNFNYLDNLFLNILQEAFCLRSIIPVFLVGMQRAIFITESSLGTSAISASACDNDSNHQGLLEVLGIHITTFIVCLTTFIIIVTSNYMDVNFENINGIEIVMNAFSYHFGNIGGIFLSIITVLFAFSTIISSYYFGESNLKNIFKSRFVSLIFKIIFMIILVVSCYVKSNVLWNFTDYFVALLVFINVSSVIKISKRV